MSDDKIAQRAVYDAFYAYSQAALAGSLTDEQARELHAKMLAARDALRACQVPAARVADYILAPLGPLESHCFKCGSVQYGADAELPCKQCAEAKRGGAG